MRLELPWPDLASFPDYGLVRPRIDFDELLARQAEKAGAVLREHTTVTGPVLDERTGRITGVTARGEDGARSPTAPRSSSPPTATPAGSPSRMGLHKRDDRPMGVAVRTYYTSPRHDDDWLESWLELWDRGDRRSRAAAARLRLDLRRRRRHVQRRARHPQHQHGVGQGRLQGPAAALARPDAGGVGLPRGEPHPAGPRRGAADGLQPPAALHPRAAAGRRLRRHGQPVQRRGHRLRHGVRRDRRRGHRAGAGPPDAPTAASGRCRPTRRCSRRPTAATTRSGACS